jgi:signal transduction histidine kinase
MPYKYGHWNRKEPSSMSRTPEDQALIDALTRRAEQAERLLEDRQRDLARLRHDLRGILSPALLLADQLSSSEEPMARRTAEAVIRTVERAEEALTRRD